MRESRARRSRKLARPALSTLNPNPNLNPNPKTNMQHVQQMIEDHGGFEAVQQNYLRIENEPFMRLVIELIGGPYPNGAF